MQNFIKNFSYSVCVVVDTEILSKEIQANFFFFMNINKAIFTIHSYASWLTPKLPHASNVHDLSRVSGVKRQMNTVSTTQQHYFSFERHFFLISSLRHQEMDFY